MHCVHDTGDQLDVFCGFDLTPLEEQLQLCFRKQLGTPELPRTAHRAAQEKAEGFRRSVLRGFWQ